MGSFSAEEERAIAEMIRREQSKGVGRGRFMDFGNGPEDVSAYIDFQVPGTQPLLMKSDPFCLFAPDKAAALKKRGVGFAWRNPNCKHSGGLTRMAVQRGVLRQVTLDDLEGYMGKHSCFDTLRIPGTSASGSKQQIRKDKECLYEVAPEHVLLWCGEAWVRKYKKQLVEMSQYATQDLRAQGFSTPTTLLGHNPDTALVVKDTKIARTAVDAISDTA